MNILFLKGLLGASIVIIMSFIAKSKFFIIAGLVPLFPTFALIAHVLVYQSKGISGTKETILFGMLSLIPYFIYLLGVYLLIDKYKLYLALIISTVFWFLSAFIIYYIYMNYLKS